MSSEDESVTKDQKKTKKKVQKRPSVEDEGSDIEMKSALPKKSKKKIPKSPSVDMLKENKEPKKMTTKDMINQALTELKQRKGVSLYAIKKYIEENYSVDMKKINSNIKKQIKTGVETGTILQIKGVGASGSFKLVPTKPEKKDKKQKKVTEKKPSMEKGVKKNLEKSTEPKKKMTKLEKEAKAAKNIDEVKNKTEKSKVVREKKEKIPKFKGKGLQTPAKKRAAMMKRTSIGSIIKPPKMKPQAK